MKISYMCRFTDVSVYVSDLFDIAANFGSSRCQNLLLFIRLYWWTCPRKFYFSFRCHTWDKLVELFKLMNDKYGSREELFFRVSNL
jgi:hypothetical protein